MTTHKTKYRIAYFVSHPIQYQAPLLKRLGDQEDIELSVFFLCDISTKTYSDAGFDRDITWDVPLLEGYDYQFLESTVTAGDFSLTNPNVKFKSLKRSFLSEQWDAVWIHGYANLALLYLCYLCRLNRIPLLLRGESNLVCTSHGMVKMRLMRIFLRQFSALLSIGTDNRTFYEYHGVANDRIFSVPYAVDNTFFQSQLKDSSSKSENSDVSKTVVLYASKFIERKNPLLLIQAYQKIAPQTRKNSQLWLIGDGEQRPLLERFIDEHDLRDQVKLLGFKNQTELPACYAQCDVFVLPSSKEPFGLVINEVMNLAKAIITTDEVGAAKDLVKHLENGWIVEAGSCEKLSLALEEALANKTLLNEMGRRSLEIIDKWDYSKDIDGIRAALAFVKSAQSR